MSVRIIAGKYRSRRIHTVEGPGYRPATAKVREALFNMLDARDGLQPGARVLDCFAGSGALALEALSRGAGAAFMVELSRPAVNALKKTLAELELGPPMARVVNTDTIPFLAKGPGREAPFDLVFVDPPYGQNLTARCLVQLVKKGWLAPGAMVSAEIETHAPIPTIPAVPANPVVPVVPAMPRGPGTSSPDASETVSAPGLVLETDRVYGQTRILLWRAP